MSWALDVKPKDPWNNALSLLGTCHQIHHEALHIAYAACTFDISFFNPPEPDASQKHIDLVQNVVISERSLLRFSLFKILTVGMWHFPGIVRVVVKCKDSGLAGVVDDVRDYFSRPSLEVEFDED